ncbi:MAG: AprI/Inh family metalloprotease inhibitor [Xanthobacteraceae bacterium]
MISAQAALAAACLIFLAGCDVGRFGSTNGASPPAVAVAAAPEKPAPPPVDMAGRWLLASTDGRKCGMTFTTASPANASASAPGKIAPEGGCPGKFFTSRSFIFDQSGSLVIRDHTGAPLGQLSFAGSGRFDGQGTDGQTLSLTR